MNHYRVCETCGFYQESRDRLDTVCPACATPARGAPTRYCVPQFGFVADPTVEPAGTTLPQRGWHGSTHVLELAKAPKDYPLPLSGGGSVRCRAGSRGRLVAISDGPAGRGFWICDRCGWGRGAIGKRPDTHTDPLKNRPCTGPLSHLSLAHAYETDIVEISFDDGLDMDRTPEATRFSLCTRSWKAPPPRWGSAATTSTGRCSAARRVRRP